MSQPVKVVTALLIKDNMLLMCQRNEQKIYPLHWEFPGGKVEEGETLIEALCREIHEELHLVVNDATEWFDDVMTYSNNITYHVTFFVVNDFLGDPVNTEFNAIDWITRETLPTLLHLSGNMNIIKKLISEGYPVL